MRIYMAGVYGGAGRSTEHTSSVHAAVSQLYQYPYVLESFHYANAPLMKAIEKDNATIFLDSGAFSMFTQGVKVDLHKYAQFITHYRKLIHIASNLDVIGEGHERESYDRQKQLEGLLKGHQLMVQPVHHVRDDDSWLERYLDEGYDYIFLGGMVPESTPVLKQWLDRVWSKYLTNPDGTAKVKIHGFGLTTLSLIFRYPWYSVDSTSWLMASRFGSMLLDIKRPDGSIIDVKVDFSNRSMKRYDLDSWHFNSLPDDEKKLVLDHLASLPPIQINDRVRTWFQSTMGCEPAFTPEALGKSFALRDIGNMEYFRRAMERKVDQFTSNQPTLWEAWD